MRTHSEPALPPCTRSQRPARNTHPHAQVDAERCRILPDGSRWLVDLWGAASDLALANKPYVVRSGTAKKRRSGAKWLMPLLAYGQVCLH